MKKKPTLSGHFALKTEGVDDHYSMMTHFRKAVKKQWGVKDTEFWVMLQDYMIHCPKKCKYNVPLAVKRSKK